MSPDVADDIDIEIDAAKREIGRESAVADRVLRRLENARQIITSTGSAITAAVVTSAAFAKLLPAIESCIQAVQRVLGQK